MYGPLNSIRIIGLQSAYRAHHSLARGPAGWANTAGGFLSIASIPASKQSGKARVLARTDGAMVLSITDSLATISFTIMGQGIIGISINGLATAVLSPNELHNIIAILTAAGDIDVEIFGSTSLGLNIKVSELTQGDVTGACLDAPIEGTYTLRQMMKLLVSVAAGESVITDLGGGNATVVFKDITTGTIDRITAAMEDSERVSVDKDIT